MKALYARFVLFLIGPALRHEHACREKRQEQDAAERAEQAREFSVRLGQQIDRHFQRQCPPDGRADSTSMNS